MKKMNSTMIGVKTSGILVLIIFFTMQSFSQSFEISFNNSISNKTYCGFELLDKNALHIIEPALDFNIKKHSIHLGVGLPIISKENSVNIESAIGISFGYKYFFASTSNDIFSFFSTYNFSYYRLKYNSGSSGFMSYWHVNHMFNQLGAGVKCRIANRLYFTLDLLFGFTSFKNIPTNVSYGDPLYVHMIKHKHENIFYFRTGISYNLEKRK
jgi:hypothetical protein